MVKKTTDITTPRDRRVWWFLLLVILQSCFPGTQDHLLLLWHWHCILTNWWYGCFWCRVPQEIPTASILMGWVSGKSRNTLRRRFVNTQWHNLQNQHVSAFDSSNLNNPFSSLDGCTCPADVSKLEADGGEVSWGRDFCPGCMMCSIYCVKINWHNDFLGFYI